MNDTVCIVGKHNATRNLPPWDDLTQDIWLFNDTMWWFDQEGAWAKRCSALFDLHWLDRYENSRYQRRIGQWVWLQKPHPYPVYLIKADPRVPSGIEYPFNAVMDALKPKRLLTSSPAYAFAMAIYLGYKRIRMYGIEMETDTEYQEQLQGIIYWVGYAQGRGIEVDTVSGKWVFEKQPLYGRERLHTHSWNEFRSKMSRLREEAGWITKSADWIR